MWCMSLETAILSRYTVSVVFYTGEEMVQAEKVRFSAETKVFCPKQNEDTAGALCFLKSTEKFAAIQEVVDSCTVFDKLHSRKAFVKAVFDREFLKSTGIGHGVAVAHGKLASIENVIVGLGISQRGIPFRSVDGGPVHILFVIGSSPEKQKEYLSSLGSLMRYVKNPAVRSYLKNLSSLDHPSEELYRPFFSMMASQHFVLSSHIGR